MRVLADGRVRRTEAEWRGLVAKPDMVVDVAANTVYCYNLSPRLINLRPP